MPTPATPRSTVQGETARRLVADMERITMDRIGAHAVENAGVNRDLIASGKTIADLRDAGIGGGDSAIILAAGPSIKRHDPIRLIKERGYDGTIIATDSAIFYCLRNGVVPDLAVSLDPHGGRIVRWFGDPDLTFERCAQDDYFRRQDMDDSFHNEIRSNEEVLRLINAHGPQIKIALATSSSTQVAGRAHQSGMDIYWWNPFYDDPDRPESITRRLWERNRVPLMNAGGNVGTASWMIAHAVLGKKHVALCGLDFSYYADTPYQQTQYYKEALEIVGADNLEEMYIHIHNPHLDQGYYTDPAYMWYRECFLSLVPDADCTTYNCTEGGILFGDGIVFTPLRAFLDKFAPEPTGTRRS